MFRQVFRSSCMLCSAVIAPKIAHEVPPNVNEGWERVKLIFERDEEIGTFSPEVTTVIQTSLFTALVGACYGGFLHSREGYLRFFEKNQATQFVDHYEAKKSLQNAVTVSFAKGALKWSWRLALFSSLYVSSVTVFSCYRGDDSIIDFAAAGALSGSIYRIKYGMRGMIVGGTLGLMIGLFAGGLTMLILRVTDRRMTDFRQSHSEYIDYRKRAAAQAVKRRAIESKNQEMAALMKSHDLLKLEQMQDDAK